MIYLWIMSKYLHKSHNVLGLMYHIVRPTKYRKIIFEKKTDKIPKEICLKIEKRNMFYFLLLQTVIMSISCYGMEKELFWREKFLERNAAKIILGAEIAYDKKVISECRKIAEIKHDENVISEYRKIIDLSEKLPPEIQIRIARYIWPGLVQLNQINYNDNSSFFKKLKKIVRISRNVRPDLCSNGHKIATFGIPYKTIKIKELNTGHTIKNWRCKHNIREIIWHPNASKLAVILLKQKGIIIYNTETKQEIATIIIKDIKGLNNVCAWSPKTGKYIAAACNDDKIEIYDTHSATKTHTLKLPNGWSAASNLFFPFAWSPDEEQMAVESNSEIIIFNLDSLQEIQRIKLGNSANIIAWYANKIIAHLFFTTTIKIFELENKKTITYTTTYQDQCCKIAYLPKYARLATGYRNGAIVIWNKKSPHAMQIIKHDADTDTGVNQITNLRWSAHGKKLLGASFSGIVSIYEFIKGYRGNNPIKTALKYYDKEEKEDKKLTIEDVKQLCYGENGALSLQKMRIMIFYLEYILGSNNSLVKRGKKLIAACKI